MELSSVLQKPDMMIGQEKRGYKFLKYVGKGKIGVVYKAEGQEVHDIVACKIIPTENLKKGWEIEVKKAVRLHGIPQVVQYRQHFPEMIENIPHTFIMWDYVEGENLRDYCQKHSREITMSSIRN